MEIVIKVTIQIKILKCTRLKIIQFDLKYSIAMNLGMMYQILT